MSNLDKDLVSDYLREYPVLRYIMPGITINGNNVTHRVYMLRQAMWVLIQIIEAKDSDFGDVAGHAAAGTTPKANDLVKAGATADVELTLKGPVLAYADPSIPKDASGTANRIGGGGGVWSCLTNQLQINEPSSKYLTIQDIALLGIFLNVADKNFVANGAQVVNALKTDQDIKSSTSGIASTDFGSLLDALATDIGGPEKIAQLKGLITVASDLGVNNVTKIGSLDGAKSMPSNVPLLHTFKPTPYVGTTFNNIEMSSLFPGVANTIAPVNGFKLLENSILASRGTVYNFLSPAPKSQIGAMALNFTKGTPGTHYHFQQDETGLFQLVTIANGQLSARDYTSVLQDLTSKGDNCTVFGGSGKYNICAKMISDCVSQGTHDTDQCIANFKGLPQVSTHLKGWKSLPIGEQRYMAYRVLLGLNLPPVLNRNGDYSYFTDSLNVNLVYSDNNLIKHLQLDSPVAEYDPEPVGIAGTGPTLGSQIFITGATGTGGTPGKSRLAAPGPLETAAEAQLVAEKLEYVKKLMNMVGTIQTPTRPGSNRPTMDELSPPVYQVFSGTFIPNYSLPGMALKGLTGGARDHIESSIEELENSTIMYGGSHNDVLRMISSISNKIKMLDENGQRLTPQNRAYIQSKLDSFSKLSESIDTIENLLVSYITLRSQYPNKEIAFTNADIERLQKKQQEDKAKLVEKMAKMARLDTKLIYARN